MNTPNTEVEKIVADAVKSVTRDDDGLIDIGKYDEELLTELLMETSEKVANARVREVELNIANQIKEARVHCPEAAGFEGPDTYADCGECIVCRLSTISGNNKEV